jgi:ubiquinone/menaquinone biosynthesis C-methylase UbiE
MDYDQTNMPEHYDRGRRQPPGVLEMWLDRIAAAVPPAVVSSVIDLGCGTGRFSEALATRFDAAVLGVDPSEKMLAHARAKNFARVTFVQGSGEDIPCPSASVDLVFASMAFHHFKSPDQVARECERVLREGGAVCIRNSTTENGSPYEAYFPNYGKTLSSLPAATQIIETFARNGFQLSRHEVVPHKMADSIADLAEKAAFRADSTLQRLSDSDFESGIRNMRRAALGGPGSVMINIDLLTFHARR